MSNYFYVYMLVDPQTSLPFYVGKGSGYRPNKHLNETAENTENYKKYCFIKGLRSKGLEPLIVKVRENLFEDEAYQIEADTIQLYGRKDIDPGGILTNICIDNRPPRPKWDDERRQKASDLMKGNTRWDRGGAPYPERAKKLISQKLLENHPNRGKPLYTLYVEKYGEELAAVKWEERRKKQSESNTGRRHTDESKQKMREVKREANKGRVHITLLGEDLNQHKFVLKTEVEKYVEAGWVIGRIGFSRHR
jgi:hypothetical protein